MTVLTDIADYPPHFWIEPLGGDIICGSERAVVQARALGICDGRIFHASGMILHPRFYQTISCDRRAERKLRGLDPDAPTGLVLFGGQGSEAMLDIAERLDAEGPHHLQLIFICGRNEKLAKALRGRPSKLRTFVEGFTAQVPFYMAISDFFIGKPGPGSVSEAVAMNLPVIVERNAWTLPQERYNADWVLRSTWDWWCGGRIRFPLPSRNCSSAGIWRAFAPRRRQFTIAAVYEIPGILRKM